MNKQEIKSFRQEMALKEIERATDRLMEWVQYIGASYIVGAVVILAIKNI